MDGRNPAPPKKPWLKPLFVGICRDSDHPRASERWCEMDFVHQHLAMISMQIQNQERLRRTPHSADFSEAEEKYAQAHRCPFLGCFARRIDGDSWFAWWFNHIPGPSISPKRTPMLR